ncbi:MAG: hypothetical protein JO372_10105, partial [Solirubrobacterales bacterium]|nr:hypothetical protein [Solirubrobacterales bacterium]
TVTAPSLDEKQGLVDYLVEVCDPCEGSGYEINGVPVSDFVTPEYYETTATPGTRHNFLGTIERRFGLLANGYISWQTRLPNRAIWQATTDSDNGEPQFRQVPETPSRLSREWIDAQTLRHPAIVGPRSQWRYSARSSTDWARAFHRDTDELLRWLKRERKHPPSIDEIISVLNDVVKDWDGFNDDNAKLKRKLRNELGITTQRAPQLASKKDYEDVIKALRQQQKVSGVFGPDMFSPDAALWLCMLIG